MTFFKVRRRNIIFALALVFFVATLFFAAEAAVASNTDGSEIDPVCDGCHSVTFLNISAQPIRQITITDSPSGFCDICHVDSTAPNLSLSANSPHSHNSESRSLNIAIARGLDRRYEVFLPPVSTQTAHILPANSAKPTSMQGGDSLSWQPFSGTPIASASSNAPSRVRRSYHALLLFRSTLNIDRHIVPHKHILTIPIRAERVQRLLRRGPPADEDCFSHIILSSYLPKRLLSWGYWDGQSLCFFVDIEASVQDRWTTLQPCLTFLFLFVRKG